MTRQQLDTFVGNHISVICGNGYANDGDNHCAHYVSHVLRFAFGATCRMMTGGAGTGREYPRS